MTRTDAERAVRERWERLGLEPTKFPHVFKSDVENLRGWIEKHNDAEIQAAYRKQTGETGRSVPQYSDPAGGE